MKIIDISIPLHDGMVTWDGQEKFKRKEIKAGEAIISLLEMSSHTGTHVDAPKHFVRGGKSLDKIVMSRFIGPCKVIELPINGRATQPSHGFGGQARSLPTRLAVGQVHRLKKGDRVLFKTNNSKRRLLEKKKFTKNYVSLSLADAQYLVKKKISLVGIDYLGIEAKGNLGHPVHKTLLEAGIVIVEGLDLSKVKPGRYNLAVLPLKIVDGDGAPARAVLWK